MGEGECAAGYGSFAEGVLSRVGMLREHRLLDLARSVGKVERPKKWPHPEVNAIHHLGSKEETQRVTVSFVPSQAPNFATVQKPGRIRLRVMIQVVRHR